jgi:hypothetical protein
MKANEREKGDWKNLLQLVVSLCLNPFFSSTFFHAIVLGHRFEGSNERPTKFDHKRVYKRIATSIKREILLRQLVKRQEERNTKEKRV